MAVTTRIKAASQEVASIPRTFKLKTKEITNLLGTATGAAVGNSATDAMQSSLNAQSAVENNDTVEQVKFALEYPRIAIAIGSVHKDLGSTLEPNISTIASTFQLNLFPNSEFGDEGGVGNAFRHVLWQAIIT